MYKRQADDYGSQIVATAAGVVTFAGYTDGGYGNLVEIDHGNGFVTRYGHNSAVLVTVGMSAVSYTHLVREYSLQLLVSLH